LRSLSFRSELYSSWSGRAPLRSVGCDGAGCVCAFALGAELSRLWPGVPGAAYASASADARIVPTAMAIELLRFMAPPLPPFTESKQTKRLRRDGEPTMSEVGAGVCRPMPHSAPDTSNRREKSPTWLPERGDS